MPFTAGNFGVRTTDLFTSTSNDAVKANVVFERIGADNVVVVGIEETNDNPTRLVDASSDRFELYGNVNVLGDNRFKNGQRKTIICLVFAGLFDRSPCKRGVVVNDSPFPGPPPPVSANLKSDGAAPTSILAMATTVAADCDMPSNPEVTRIL